MDKIRVLLVEDNQLQRQALARIVSSSERYRVVAQAADGRAALERYELDRPDIVLMDLNMPVMNGVEATERLVAEYPEACIVVMTALATEEYLVPALAAGAMGYVTKDLDSRLLLDTLDGACRGELKLPGAVTRSLVDMMMRTMDSESQQVAVGAPAAQLKPRAVPAGRTDALGRLTNREQQVIDLLAEGYSNARIADELHISEATVKANLSRIMDKVHAENRLQLLVKALRMGLVTVA